MFEKHKNENKVIQGFTLMKGCLLKAHFNLFTVVILPLYINQYNKKFL